MNIKRLILVLTSTFVIILAVPSFGQVIQRSAPGLQHQTAGFVAGAFGQRLPGPPGQAFDPMVRLQEAFSLTPSQVESLKALLQERMNAMQSLMAEREQKTLALEAIAQQANPDPADLGAALLAVRAVEEKVRALHAKFETDFKSLLSVDQKKLLEDTIAAASRLPALAALGLGGGPFPYAHSFAMSLPPGN